MKPGLALSQLLMGSGATISRRSKEGGDQGDEPRQIERNEEKVEVTSDFSDHGAISFVMLFDDLKDQTHDPQEEVDDGQLG